MKVMVLGCNGQLGQTLRDSCPAGISFAGLDEPDIDIGDSDSVRVAMNRHRPEWLINAAAYTAVDKAESKPHMAERVNVDGARLVAQAASEIGARVVHISTDFVFDGEANRPYRTDDPARPLSVYGRTKRDGELAVMETANHTVVIRTAWLYSKYGNNFVKTMLRLMNERDVLRVIDDQRGTPTWCGSLAPAIWVAVGKRVPGGIYHRTDDGEATWCEFAREIYRVGRELDLVGREVEIVPIPTSEYPTPARRPRYSVLDCSLSRDAIGLAADHWTVSLRRMLEGMAV